MRCDVCEGLVSESGVHILWEVPFGCPGVQEWVQQKAKAVSGLRVSPAPPPPAGPRRRILSVNGALLDPATRCPGLPGAACTLCTGKAEVRRGGGRSLLDPQKLKPADSLRASRLGGRKQVRAGHRHRRHGHGCQPQAPSVRGPGSSASRVTASLRAALCSRVPPGPAGAHADWLACRLRANPGGLGAGPHPDWLSRIPRSLDRDGAGPAGRGALQG